MASSQSEKARQAAHEKRRVDMLEDFERQRAELAKDAERNRTGSDRFVGISDSTEEALKMQSIGLVRLEDFQQRRQALEEERRREAANTNALKDGEGPRKRRKKRAARLNLSFDDGGGDAGESDAHTDEAQVFKKQKFGKDPSIDTSFLPDREREEADRGDREELRQEWLRLQEQTKGEEIEITYSFWDGTGHRKEVTCQKGDTILRFLEKVRAQWPDLRQTSLDNLLYIKEDLIIPHHYTFYDFIVSKARGKSGPLFVFDAHDDVRLLADATVAKDESHAGKVVERSWYNRNKHIFPQSRWEPFHPSKVFSGKYTVRS